MGHHGARFCEFRHRSAELLVYCRLTTILEAYNFFDDNYKRFSSFFEWSLENTLSKFVYYWGHISNFGLTTTKGAIPRSLCPSGYYITPNPFTEKVAPPYYCRYCGHTFQSPVRSVTLVFVVRSNVKLTEM